eukprot:1215508-Prorocentrum_lima.AAC.1
MGASSPVMTPGKMWRNSRTIGLGQRCAEICAQGSPKSDARNTQSTSNAPRHLQVLPNHRGRHEH